MALFKMVRDSGYADWLRAYEIVLDGKTISEVRNGEMKCLSVSPGQQEVYLRISWCRSNPVEFIATEDEAVVFNVRSSLRGARLLLGLWYILLAPNSYLQLERADR